MDTELAKEIAARLGKASSLCDSSLRVVMSNDSIGLAQVYGRLVGQFMGQAYTNVLGPIWKAFPALEPSKMREPYVEREPRLSPESRQALSKFLTEARAAIEFARASVPAHEAKALFTYGGVNELEEAVSEIERFLERPWAREPKGSP
jgi:hypothetical protein